MVYTANAGPMYTACFSGAALTASQMDVFGILPPSNSRVMIHEICVGESFTATIAEQIINVQIIRGSTASSTSAVITPSHIHGWTGVPVAGSVVTGPSSALVSTASAVLLHADTWNVTHGSYIFHPDEYERPILAPSQRLHFRIGASTTAQTLSATITFSEIGKTPLS